MSSSIAAQKNTTSHTLFTQQKMREVWKGNRKILCAKMAWISEVYQGKEGGFDFQIQACFLKKQSKPRVKSVLDIVSPLPFKWRRTEQNWMELNPSLW